MWCCAAPGSHQDTQPAQAAVSVVGTESATFGAQTPYLLIARIKVKGG
eukprot:SAG31_NODE_39811_length_285_cov_0.838710_1_plen_47_part_01